MLLYKQFEQENQSDCDSEICFYYTEPEEGICPEQFQHCMFQPDDYTSHTVLSTLQLIILESML